MLRLPRCSELSRIVFRSGAVPTAFLSAGLIAAPPAAAQGASSLLTKPDPLKIVVSLEKQHMYVYRGTERVFTSRVSTGKRGYSTPAGVYSILEKRRWHRSNIYNNAPMPFMQRLTWSGIALHASGHVPRYPASHGCIRLPRGSASTLFKKTDVGGHVIVTRGETTPHRIKHDKLLQPQPLDLVTMDARKALKKRLAYEEGNLVSIALPAPADRARKYASLTRPQDKTVMTDATNAPEPMSAKEGALLMADLEHDMHRLESYIARSEEPVRILITKRLGRERIRDVQMLLRELGYDPGPIDGFMGRLTGAAIQEYQEDKGLKATGAFSEELRDKLFLDARGEPAPTGHLYVRQGFKQVFDAPVRLKNPDEPLGTHVYFSQSFAPTDEQTQWLALTTEEAPGVDANAALDRVSIPRILRDRLERMLTPGSSMIISDAGLGRETGRGTDFVVQP
ncbi:L,D-transpeptidase family protein [Dichotomicrobium thermohalophilum]|nr:L,D-transpeptidase family protein [Dichotomicrobium thermohalophilum]